MATTWSARFHELCVYWAWWKAGRPRPRRAFVIFGHPRSGSQLLRNLLGQHPAVHCDGEVLLKFLEAWPRRVLLPRLYMWGMAARRKADYYGCVLREDHLFQTCGRSGSLLADLGPWKLIHLIRQNALRLALSHVRADVTGRWMQRHPGPVPLIELPPEQVADCLDWTLRVRDHEQATVNRFPHLSLEYSQDLMDSTRHQATADRVFQWLGLPACRVAAGLVRQGLERWQDGVKNAAAIEAELNRRGFASWLEFDEAERRRSSGQQTGA